MIMITSWYDGTLFFMVTSHTSIGEGSSAVATCVFLYSKMAVYVILKCYRSVDAFCTDWTSEAFPIPLNIFNLIIACLFNLKKNSWCLLGPQRDEIVNFFSKLLVDIPLRFCARLSDNIIFWAPKRPYKFFCINFWWVPMKPTLWQKILIRNIIAPSSDINAQTVWPVVYKRSD